jgi:peptidoglycan/xylan/chitin deacetylase (PgdA/CDA1 family)
MGQGRLRGRGRQPRSGRRPLFSGGLLCAALVCTLAGAVTLAPSARGQSVETIVSITFDDGYSDQAPARASLTSHGMDATFYVNSGNVGLSGYFTWTQLQELRDDGNEIAGHTINHARLTDVSVEEARHQVCDDRAALVSHGFSPISFAYPESLYNATVQQIVRDCGYLSGRTVGYLWDLCSGCPYAESIPPADSYALRTPNSIKYTTTLDTMKNYVTQAETHGGGWVPLVFHHICNACVNHAITEADFTAFLDWLQPRAANGTIVKTVGQVMASLPPPPPPTRDPTVVSLNFDRNYADQASTRSLLTSHGMDATFYVNSGSVGLSGYLTWTQLQELRDDGNEIAGETINHTKLTQVTTEEARHQVCDDRAALVGHGFSPTSFAYPYSAYDATVQQIVRDCGYSSARTVGRLADLCAGCPYAESIPPADAYAIRTPNSIKSTTTLDTIKSYVTLAETHGGGWVVLLFNHVCDGCHSYAITQANLTAFLDWLQARAADGTVVKTVGQVIQTPPPPPPPSDTTPPTSSISCNGVSCSTSWYRSAVSVALSATDEQGGSGVTATRYTTDGSDPTVSSPAYAGPFTVATTTTVKFRSWDAAGNIEAMKSQLIRVDVTQPDVALTSPTDGSLVKGLISVTATAADADSGIAKVDFFVDTTLIGTRASLPYKVSWNTRKSTRGQHVLYAVAYDVAGNSRRTPDVRVTVG